MNLSLYHDETSLSRNTQEKAKIASAFGRAASRYDSLASYQQNSGKQLLSLLESLGVIETPMFSKQVLDAGCGTGFFSQIIKQTGAHVTALDLSAGMLDVARNKQSAAINWSR